MAWDIRDKTVLITGGNAGIGLETALELGRRGARVWLTSRSAERGAQVAHRISQETGARVGAIVLDLASFESIRRAAAEVLERCPELHVLINNAGAIYSERAETREGFEMTLGVNHVGPFLLTQLLLERLKASSPGRIINVSSEAHRKALGGFHFDDPQSRRGYQGWFTYCRSKLANVYFSRTLARRLQGTGVCVNALHPGFVKTHFGADGDARGWLGLAIRVLSPLALTPAQGAATSVYLASEPGLLDLTGQYFVKSRPREPSRAARDSVAAARLWSLTEQWVQRGAP